MLHKVFGEAELAELGSDFKAARAYPGMRAFLAWVANKPPQFTDHPRTRGRKPYHRARG